MEKYNKYSLLHGGYIYYLLDEASHDFAINHIGDCLTSNSSIYYHLPLKNEDFEIDIKILSKSNSSITLESKIIIGDNIYISSIFTFIKIKK